MPTLVDTVATVDLFSKVSINTPSGPIVMPSNQAQAMAAPQLDVFKTISSQSSTPQWGSFADFVIQPADITVLADVVVRIDVGAITGITGSPSLVEGNFLIQRVELSIADRMVEVLYPESFYVRDLLYYTTEQKNRFMRLSGNNTLSARQALAAAGQSFYIEVPSFWTVNNGFFMRQLNAPMKMRVVLANLSDVVQLNAGTGTAACSVSAVSLIASGREFTNPATTNALIQAQRKIPRTYYRWLTPIQMSKQTLVAGSATYSINLTSINQMVSHIFMFVRSPTTVANPYNNDPTAFTPLYSFDIKTTGGVLITGGSEITHAYNVHYQSCLYWPGSAEDVASGFNIDPKALYTVAFAQDPLKVEHQGAQLGGYNFSGTETLNLTFSAALTSNLVVDVIAMSYASLVVDNAGNAAKL